MQDHFEPEELDGHLEYVIQIKDEELELSNNYIFRLETWHDGELREVDYYSDAIAAVTSFAKCSDVGLAEKTADYVLIQPNAKVTSKSFTRLSNLDGHNGNHQNHQRNISWLSSRE